MKLRRREDEAKRDEFKSVSLVCLVSSVTCRPVHTLSGPYVALGLQHSDDCR